MQHLHLVSRERTASASSSSGEWIVLKEFAINILTAVNSLLGRKANTGT